MPRPTSISDERILAAAHQVFLEKGIRGTTAEVARRAGVAEGSLFNRFKTKEGLFSAAMAWKLGAPDWLDELGRPCDDARALLEDIGHRTLEFFEQLLPVAMMILSNPTRRGRLLPFLPHTPDGAPGPIVAMQRLSSWFAAQMEGAAMRRQDPEVAARSFLGSLWHYVFFESMARSFPPDVCYQPLGRQDFVRGLVALLWDGLAPSQTGAPATPPPGPAHASARTSVPPTSRPGAGRRKAR